MNQCQACGGRATLYLCQSASAPKVLVRQGKMRGVAAGAINTLRPLTHSLNQAERG